MTIPLQGQVYNELIDKIENIVNTESQVVDAYGELCFCIFHEMNNHIKYSKRKLWWQNLNIISLTWHIN